MIWARSFSWLVACSVQLAALSCPGSRLVARSFPMAREKREERRGGELVLSLSPRERRPPARRAVRAAEAIEAPHPPPARPASGETVRDRDG